VLFHYISGVSKNFSSQYWNFLCFLWKLFVFNIAGCN